MMKKNPFLELISVYLLGNEQVKLLGSGASGFHKFLKS